MPCPASLYRASLLPVALACFLAPTPLPRPSGGGSLGIELFPGELRIKSLFISSPASQGGFSNEDVILAVDGQKLTMPADLAASLKRKKPGTVVAVTLRRGGNVLTVKVALAAPDQVRLGVGFQNGSLLLGLIAPNSPASRAGLQVGDVLTALDGTNVANSDDVAAFLKTKRPGNVIQVTVQRGNTPMKFPVKLEKRPGY